MSVTVEAITIVIGVMGLGGVVFTALKYNRDDTTAIVGQQSTILHDMSQLNEELHKSVQDLRSERDSLRGEVKALHEQVDRLSDELKRFTHAPPTPQQRSKPESRFGGQGS